MNRDAAIEAGARAAFIREAGESNTDLATRSWDNYPAEHHVKRYWRNITAAVIDAAAPHLVGEPVGYAWVDEDFDILDVARGEAGVGWLRQMRYLDATLVALVPIEDQP